MVNECYGTYPIRTISHGENIIHIPKHVTGKFAIYIDDKAETIILRKQKPLDLKKLTRDLDKASEGEVVSMEEFMDAIGEGNEK